MPSGNYTHPLLYDPESAELRAQVIAVMRALAEGGYAPSRDRWTECKPDGVPGQEWISRTWGWQATIRAAGLRARTPQDTRRLADPLQAPLTEDERHACATRGQRERGW